MHMVEYLQQSAAAVNAYLEIGFGMNKKYTEIVIPKEKAVFWLDQNGRWHNVHGEFQHKKIIDYFHSSIQKDEKGYYLFQERGNLREKVYFHYEDSALFVVDLIKDNDITLILNTKRRVKLRPKNLFTRNDNLYMRMGKETIKFTDRGLMKISDLLEFSDSQYFIKVKNRKYRIENK
jgi:hypothetical protein